MNSERLGEIAYNKYCECRDWKSVRGEPLPHFKQQSPELQEAWIKAAQAVLAEIQIQTSPG